MCIHIFQDPTAIETYSIFSMCWMFVSIVSCMKITIKTVITNQFYFIQPIIVTLRKFEKFRKVEN